MPTHSFALVLLMPILLTMVSAITLYFSFRGKVDVSGRYFLLAETLWLIVLFIGLALNLRPSLGNPALFFVFNLCALVSEVAIWFSVRALTQTVSKRTLIYALIFIICYCVFIEYARYQIDMRLPLVLISSFSLCITVMTYRACRQITGNGLDNNLFLQWIMLTELGLAAVHIVRFASYFTQTPMLAIAPQVLAQVVFSLWFGINLFRYFAYLALRISWVDPRALNDNPLNRTVTKIVQEKNQFLQSLLASNRALGVSALANSLAHQLSQPITGVILQTETVKRELLEGGHHPQSVTILNTVTEQLGKLAALVNNLRRLFGSSTNAFSAFSMRAAFDEVLEVIEPTVTAKQITLKINGLGDHIVLGNAIQIQQVIINLFNNAIDAITDHPGSERRISVSFSKEGGFALLTIADTGSGIAPAIAPSLFEPYQTTKDNGLGIGLWLCKAIIDQHAGRIWGYNHPTGGAVFEVSIPLATDHNKANPQ